MNYTTYIYTYINVCVYVCVCVCLLRIYIFRPFYQTFSLCESFYIRYVDCCKQVCIIMEYYITLYAICCIRSLF
jgi:hypothetical protein